MEGNLNIEYQHFSEFYKGVVAYSVYAQHSLIRFTDFYLNRH